jgi:hypothetical protein
MSRIDHLYWEDEGREAEDAPTAPFKLPVAKGAHTGYRWWFPECSHWRHPFKLEGGLIVYASAWFDQPERNPYSNASGFSGAPDIGFYLDGAWAGETILTSPGYRPPFLSRKIAEGRVVLHPWHDWGVPENPRQFRRALKWLLEEAGKGMVIEIGCMGGHGRTGSALACLLAHQGLSANQSIDKVRTEYCREAIESKAQIQLVRTFARRGRPR